MEVKVEELDKSDKKYMMVDLLCHKMREVDKGYYWTNQVMLDFDHISYGTIAKLANMDDMDKVIQIAENWLTVDYLYHNTTLQTFVDNPDIVIKVDNLEM